MKKLKPAVLFILVLFSSCTRSEQVAEPPSGDTPIFNPAELDAQLAINRQINSVIVSRNNSIIHEFYLTENDKNRVYNFYSAAKSVTSLIAGIAIDKGYIKNDGVYITDYFQAITGKATTKRKIQLKHLLSMTSGISWPESTQWNHFFQPMIESANWIDFILQQEMSETPGLVFNYNSGNNHLVSKIIQDATGQNMFDFAKKNLFEPLGITSVSWYNDPQGICFGGAWIRMTAKDALKIGQLILDDGCVGSRRIVSSEWIRKMTTVQSDGYRWDAFTGGEYGYGWWINTYYGHKTFFAWGANEQYIFVTPSLELVAVFNSSITSGQVMRPPEIYAEHIIKKMLTKKGD